MLDIQDLLTTGIKSHYQNIKEKKEQEKIVEYIDKLPPEAFKLSSKERKLLEYQKSRTDKVQTSQAPGSLHYTKRLGLFKDERKKDEKLRWVIYRDGLDLDPDDSDDSDFGSSSCSSINEPFFYSLN